MNPFVKEFIPLHRSKLNANAVEFYPRFKCKWGMDCSLLNCSFVHPDEPFYNETSYFQSSIRCLNESEETACRLKCGTKRGRYCPFVHCSHDKLYYMSIQCASKDCQRHCPSCV